jgi:hypothetical protein
MASSDEILPPSAVAPVISECILQLLREYVLMPFLDLREANPQARLWTMLRDRLTPKIVRATIKPHRTLEHPHVHHEELWTSRVQLQMKVGGAKVTDIIVFRADRPVTLTCYDTGPADVVAKVCPEDVEAAIEIKAAPSWNRKDRRSFADDIEKLHELRTKAAPHLCCFFVLLDKSLSVPGATSSRLSDGSWRTTLLERGFEMSLSPSLSCVEAWDLESGDPPIPRVEYWSKRRPVVGQG